jgi:restriction system protein
MGRKLGFFAELQHQNQLAQKRQLQQSSAAFKAHAAAVKRAEVAQRQSERAAANYAKATVADQKAAERETKRLHEEAMLADVDQRNAELASDYEQIGGMLAATLEVDDFVNLEDLRKAVAHPPFSRSDLELPMPRVAPPAAPPEPQYVAPDGAPKGLGGVFGGKKKYAELCAQAEKNFSSIHQAWQVEVAQLPMLLQKHEHEYQQAEHDRLERLAQAQSEYEAECRQRELEVQKANGQLETLIANLAYDVEEAVQEYVSIVLGNSVYPDCFPVEHDFEFNSNLKELTLTVLVPGPQEVPNAKEYKYARAKDEITSTILPAREQKDRYADAVAQVALRTLQEVFEADRAGKIQTIALTAATETVDIATGRPKRTPLTAVAAERDTFMSFDLANVVPLATLQHLGALVSKSPFDLVSIDTSKGVRGR